MRSQQGMTLIRWIVAICCLGCVAFAAWRLYQAWRGPAPAVVDENSNVGSRWGRPVPQRPGDSESDAP